MTTADAELFNGVVSMEVNFWKLKERNSSEKMMLTVWNIMDAASGMHMASRGPHQTSRTLWKTLAHGWLRWGATTCLRVDPHRAMGKEFFDQAEGRGIFVDFVLAEAHWHMGKVRTMREIFA